jgi:cytochrome c oxidase assembly protein subunit 11
MTASANRNNRTAGIMAIVGLVMLGLAFASVPLYRVFCQVTGYGGTTQRAEVAPGADVAEGKISVRFDANTNAALPWKFEPEQERASVGKASHRIEVGGMLQHLPDAAIRDRRASIQPCNRGKKEREYAADRQQLLELDLLALSGSGNRLEDREQIEFRCEDQG